MKPINVGKNRGGPSLISPIILAVILLPGCTLYQKPVVPMNNPPEQFKLSLDSEEFRNLNNTWWKNFEIEELNQVVDKALASNYSYQATLKNIDVAQTYVLQNMTLLFPQIGLDYSLSKNKGIVNVGNAISGAPQLTGGSGI
jgi:outer membrane protein TolC